MFRRVALITFVALTVVATGVAAKEKPKSLPDPACFDNQNRYVDCGNGTVTDTVTGLIWLKYANCFGQMDYATANTAAANLADGQCGLTDGSAPGGWRLPTKEEWQMMIAQAVVIGCVDPSMQEPSLTDDTGMVCMSEGSTSFVGVMTADYWASSAHEGTPAFAWSVNLAEYASVFSVDKWIDGVFYVWPVRN